MKNCMKRKLLVLISLILVLVCGTVSQAKAVEKSERTLTVYPGSSKGYSSFLRKYTSANEQVLAVLPNTARVEALKSSDPSVLKPFVKNGGTKTNKYNKGILVKLKKAGTATVSYKVGAKEYRVEITVLPYTSPVESISMGSIDLLPKLQTKSSLSFPYGKYSKKPLKINFQAKEGWKINAGYLEKAGYQKGKTIKNNKNFKLTRKGCAVCLWAYNEETEQNIDLLLLFK